MHYYPLILDCSLPTFLLSQKLGIHVSTSRLDRGTPTSRSNWCINISNNSNQMSSTALHSLAAESFVVKSIVRSLHRNTFYYSRKLSVETGLDRFRAQ